MHGGHCPRQLLTSLPCPLPPSTQSLSIWDSVLEGRPLKAEQRQFGLIGAMPLGRIASNISDAALGVLQFSGGAFVHARRGRSASHLLHVAPQGLHPCS
jgi:hypothetical protein